MEFNGSKFEVLRCGKNNTIKKTYSSPDNKEIETKKSLRDLGIIMNEEANFQDHIDKVCGQVTQKAGWVLRTFSNRNLIYEANVEVTNTSSHRLL